MKYVIIIIISMLTHGCNIKAKQINKKTHKQSEINWIKVYEREIMTAVANEDKDAWNFFTVELLKERIRLKRLQIETMSYK